MTPFDQLPVFTLREPHLHELSSRAYHQTHSLVIITKSLLTGVIGERRARENIFFEELSVGYQLSLGEQIVESALHRRNFLD